MAKTGVGKNGTADRGQEEFDRLSEDKRDSWRRWGPYVSERAWASVREDYSDNGDTWRYFPHDHARMRAYRWSEDALAGFCDDHQNICMGLALWNGKDPILKERLFGLTGIEGNHGEDVKELYYYLDCTPSNSWVRMLYRYPHIAFPYGRLKDENQDGYRPERELYDLLHDEFAAGRYFDVTVEYAKVNPDDILCRITVKNQSPKDTATLHVLPQLWFRNTWSWDAQPPSRPSLELVKTAAGTSVATVKATGNQFIGDRWWYVRQNPGVAPELLFTQNESHGRRLGWNKSDGFQCKDAFHIYLVPDELETVKRLYETDLQRESFIDRQSGTKAAAHFERNLEPGKEWQIEIRFSNQPQEDPFGSFASTMDARSKEADAFYSRIQTSALDDDAKQIQRQALASLLFSQQFYSMNTDLWLEGDSASPPSEARKARLLAANWDHWRHLDAMNVILMPDKWEYPWFAAWDLAFHAATAALVDPELAKQQLLLLMREYYMHPNGQLPAYEWNFSDLNPPVAAWAVLETYNLEKSNSPNGQGDRAFLERAFHKLMLSFTWWVNRQDSEGDNLFEGGFLGLDNISIIDRSVLNGKRMDQADATAWMAMFCSNMFAIAVEMAIVEPQYEDIAIKFFDHYAYIARSMLHPEQIRPDLESLWDDSDGFFYDHLYQQGANHDIHLKIKSFVGLVPLLAAHTYDASVLQKLPALREHMEWLIANRPELLKSVAPLTDEKNGQRMLSLFTQEMLTSVLTKVLDENRFMSPYGVRSLSKEHAAAPFTAHIDDKVLTVSYLPGEGVPGQYKGGNSNWRGPIWMPVNYLIIRALLQYAKFYGNSMTVPLTMADGSKQKVTLAAAASEIASRVISMFREKDGVRPAMAANDLFRNNGWRNQLLFHEYFHGDDGRGLGANHQTGWTALIARIIQEFGSGGQR
jgi:hypothetical protein